VIKKIISGGQTGADAAGLVAGRELGLETGGTAPPGFMTDDGPRPNILKHYGLVEGERDTSIYRLRTIKNVKESDGTVIFGNADSPGCRLTINTCKRLKKRYIVNPDASVLRYWVKKRNIETLNVAGNRERTNPGIFYRTHDTIREAFKK